MKILLLNPPFKGKFSRSSRSPAVTKSGTIYYPIWLAYATGVLEKEGFEVKLVDAPAGDLEEGEVMELAKTFEPDMLVLDTSTPSINNDLRIATKLKKLIPNTFLIAVGTHATVLSKKILTENFRIDAIARKEYEYTLRELVHTLNNGDELRAVQGISYRDHSRVVQNPDRHCIEELDELPFVSSVYKKHLNIKDYFYSALLYPEVTIISGRGCPYRCFFCLYPQTMHGRKYRLRSAQNVVDELEYISTELPEVNEVIFEDDTFTANRKRVREIADLILERGLKIVWSVNCRADLDLETMHKMKQAGCRILIAGYESGSQTILDNMRKGIKISQMLDFAKNAKKTGLLVHGCFMVGNPGETGETLVETLKLAKKLNADTAQFFPLMVYPGTEAYAWAKENRFLDTENFSEWLTEDGLHNCVVSTPHLSSQELVRFCDYARRSYYLRLSYILMKLKQILFDFEEARRTFKSLLVFYKHLLPR